MHHGRAVTDGRLVRGLLSRFDAAFYLSQLGAADIAPHRALSHYLWQGARRGLDPAPDFSTVYYVGRNPDLAGLGIHPFLHFLALGEREGRRGLPPGLGSAEALRTILAVLRPAFDADYYRAKYPDVVRSGIAPLIDYIERGAAAGRDPASGFSTDYYLHANPDVRAAGVNPFHHYLAQGHAEGRRPRPGIGELRAAALARAPSLDEQAGLWSRPAPADRELDRRGLRRELEALGLPERLALALCHDDPGQEIGGLQVCVSQEARAFARRGIGHLAIFPFQPLPRLARKGSDPLMMVRAGADLVGPVAVSTLAEGLGALASGGRCAALGIHALLGHAPEAVAVLAEAVGTETFFWLHDHGSLCPGHTLLRNDAEFCGAPPLGSPACRICRYGIERPAHVARMRRLFEDVAMTVVAPSRATLQLWRARSGLPARRALVAPPCEVVRDVEPAPAPAGPVRVGFAGLAAAHKGWPVFRDLLDAHRSGTSFAFHYFGESAVADPGLSVHRVRVTPDDPQAMVRALHGAAVDLVVVWPSGRETFSLTTHEAIAAGARVLCPAASGNVARAVRRHGAGRVFTDREALFETFATGSIAEAALDGRAMRRAPGRLAFGAFTAGLLEDTA